MKKTIGALFLVCVFLAAEWVGSLAEEPWDPVPFLKAFIFQQEVKIDGEIATAAIIASREDNGLGSLNRRSPIIEDLVLGVLTKDFDQHRIEYDARKHMANSESLGPRIEWNLKSVQEHLWARFFGDPRWLRRIMISLQEEAKRRGLQIKIGSLPPEQPLTTTEETVRRVCGKLSGHKTPKGPACGANPTFALREAKGEDPILVATVFSAGYFPGDEEKCFLAGVQRLKSEGWKIVGTVSQPDPN